MYDPLAGEDARGTGTRPVHRAISLDVIGKSCRDATYRNRIEVFAVVEQHRAERSLAQRDRPFQYLVENWAQVAGRRVDDSQHLGGRGLLLQCLARFGQQPRVLHRNDRLRREILQQRDLLVGERPDFLSICGYRAK